MDICIGDTVLVGNSFKLFRVVKMKDSHVWVTDGKVTFAAQEIQIRVVASQTMRI